MAFTDETVSQIWARLKGTRRNFINQTTAIKSQMAAGPVNRSIIFQLTNITSGLIKIIDVAPAADLEAHGREEERDPTLDVVGILATSRANAVTLNASVDALMPRADPSGAMEVEIMTLEADGTITYQELTVTPAQTAGLRSDIDAVIAALS